jgi:hypothetical protein
LACAANTSPPRHAGGRVRSSASWGVRGAWRVSHLLTR